MGLVAGKHSTQAAIDNESAKRPCYDTLSNTDKKLLDQLRFRPAVLWPRDALGAGDVLTLIGAPSL